MSTQEEAANLGKVLGVFRVWDRGDRTVRSRMLDTFLSNNTGKTVYELDMEFAQVSSLFLARVTTWMKLTSQSGRFLGIQLRSVGVFLSASSSDQYLMEFIEDGGVQILLDILIQSGIKEEEKSEALRLLVVISDAGRKYKEIICENHGVKVVAEFFTTSTTDQSQETASALLESLSHGNPKYQDQIYRSLISLLTCRTPKTQQLILHNLHSLQLKLNSAHHSIVDPLLNMLRSVHLEVQNEAVDLILDLKSFDVRSMLLRGLVSLLKPEMMRMNGSLPEFVQQAAAAKTLRLLAKEDGDLSHELLSLGVIQHLLYAMGNREHTEAQIQASLTLEHFIHSFPVLEEPVQRILGSSLFAAFMDKAETLYMNMDETQAEILLSNQVDVSHVMDDL